VITVPDEKDDKPDSLDRVRGDRSLARRSGFIARRARELAQKGRELKLADDVEVVFPDKYLEAAVRETLEKPKGPLTRGALRELTTLRNMGNSIEHLRGLDSAVNLTVLVLRGYQISDVSPLASLTKLNELDLFGLRISDVSSLASLTNLAELFLFSLLIRTSIVGAGKNSFRKELQNGQRETIYRARRGVSVCRAEPSSRDTPP